MITTKSTSKKNTQRTPNWAISHVGFFLTNKQKTSHLEVDRVTYYHNERWESFSSLRKFVQCLRVDFETTLEALWMSRYLGIVIENGFESMSVLVDVLLTERDVKKVHECCIHSNDCNFKHGGKYK